MSPYEHALALPKYGSWRPTQFDRAGLNADGREDWRVLPVSETRDSGPLDQSNFATACKLLEQFDDEETEAYSVETFGHWGPGWFSIILVNPEHEAAMTEAGEIACALAVYPVLDETDFSEREEAEKAETWKHCYSWRERLQMLRDNADRQEPWHDLAEIIATVRGELVPRNQRIEERLLGC